MAKPKVPLVDPSVDTTASCVGFVGLLAFITMIIVASFVR